MKDINEFLNYTLVSTKNLTINIYHLLLILAIILVTVFVLRIVKRVFKRQVNEGKIDQGSATSIYQIIKYIIWVAIIAFCLESIGIKLTLLIASSAALLVGLGLGIQQIFNDVASGIILLFERNIKVNDVIELEAGTVGRVSQIGLRTSKLITRDNISLIVPNSKLISDNVINWSLNEELTRFHVEIGVAYGSNVDLVEKTLLEVAMNHPDISKVREPFVRFVDFGESSLDFRLHFWTEKNFVVEFIKSDLRFAINREFEKNNIVIPFPQRDLHIKSKE